MAKKILGVVKLQIPAGKATPAPPVGPALAQYQINMMEFVKSYNERTAGQQLLYKPGNNGRVGSGQSLVRPIGVENA